jgi:hypothetical protein
VCLMTVRSTNDDIAEDDEGEIAAYSQFICDQGNSESVGTENDT